MAEAGLLARPERILLHYFGSALTGGRIWAESDALAAALAARGIASADRVALFLQNVPQFVIATLAAWKVGAAIVPLNAMLRSRELAPLLGDSGARAVIVLDDLYPELAAALPQTQIEVVVGTSVADYLGGPLPRTLEAAAATPPSAALRLLDILATSGDGAPASRPTPDDLAMLVYTSGTTGAPKGAMISHANVVFNARTFAEWHRVAADDVILAASPLFHVSGLIGHMCLSFLAQAPLVLGYRFEPGMVLELVERHRATFTIAAITAYIALVEHPAFSQERMATLKKVISGGAPTPPSVLERYERMTGTYLYNGYGLTETTSPSHQVPLHRRAPVDPDSGVVSIGVPVPGTDCRIVDDADRDVEVGDRGELVIRGPEVISGYWRRPEETADAFRGGWLHTGDIARRDEAGWFFVVDRKKDQINVSGFKVWPNEVEAVLYGHPDVVEVAVVGVPDRYRGETVKAFVVLRPGVEASSAELVAFCRERLAAYKYPRLIEFVPELPKSSAGKILRRALRERG